MVALAYAAAPVTGDTGAWTSIPNGTHTLPASTRGCLLLRNTHATNAETATITVPGVQYGQARPDIAIVLPTNSVVVVVGGLVGDLADPADGLIDIVTSGTGTPEARAFEV